MDAKGLGFRRHRHLGLSCLPKLTHSLALYPCSSSVWLDQFDVVGTPPKGLLASNISPQLNRRQIDSAILRAPAARAFALHPMRFCLARIQFPAASPEPALLLKQAMAACVSAQRRCAEPSLVMTPRAENQQTLSIW